MAPTAGKVEKGKPGKPGKPRNHELKPGLMMYGRSKMYTKRALWRLTALRKQKRAARPEIKPKPKRVVKPATVEKPIGGEKNGGTRKVRVKKLPASYPTESLRKKQERKTGKPKITKLRNSLTPGTVCIFVSTVHKGKRVVFLKQLPSGLCLVTGPFWMNHVPLRRVSQNYLIATKTKIDVSKVKIPDTVTDESFKRSKRRARANKKDDGEIFQSKKKKWVPSKERIHDTIAVDRQVMKAINKRQDGKQLVQYLCSKFGLQKHQYPHQMKF